jgi:hypothetical protein
MAELTYGRFDNGLDFGGSLMILFVGIVIFFVVVIAPTVTASALA